jgi:hypothetical protein
MQEGIDAARIAPSFPRRKHKRFGDASNIASFVRAATRPFDQGRDKLIFVRKQRVTQTGKAR